MSTPNEKLTKYFDQLIDRATQSKPKEEEPQQQQQDGIEQEQEHYKTKLSLKEETAQAYLQYKSEVNDFRGFARLLGPFTSLVSFYYDGAHKGLLIRAKHAPLNPENEYFKREELVCFSFLLLFFYYFLRFLLFLLFLFIVIYYLLFIIIIIIIMGLIRVC